MELYRELKKLERQVKLIDSIDDPDVVMSERLQLLRRKIDIIHEMIRNVSDPELRVILEDRYVHGLKWQEIAARRGYSMSSLYRLRLRAILALIN